MKSLSISKSKRAREAEITVFDVMYKARFIFGRDPFKEQAPTIEERRFRALFGCSAIVATELWKLLDVYDFIPEGGKLIHMLWALLFVKVYPTEETLVKLCGDPMGNPDKKTTRKWIRLLMEAISYLSEHVVSLVRSRQIEYWMMVY